MRRVRLAGTILAMAGIAIVTGTPVAQADPWDGRSVVSGGNSGGKAQVTFANDSADQWSCVAWLWDSSKKSQLEQYLADWHRTGYNPGVIETLGDPVGTKSAIAPANRRTTVTVAKYLGQGQGATGELQSGSYVGFGACSGEGNFNSFDVSGESSGPGGDPGAGAGTWGSLENLIP